MSYEQLKEDLANLHKQAITERSHFYTAKTVRKALDAIAELEKNHLQWNRAPLPDKGESVVIYAEPKHDGTWSVGLAYRNVNGYWNIAESPWARANPTHWMPLPKPPEPPEPTARKLSALEGRVRACLSCGHYSDLKYHPMQCANCHKAWDRGFS